MLIHSQKLVERDVSKIFHANAFGLTDLEHFCYRPLSVFMFFFSTHKFDLVP